MTDLLTIRINPTEINQLRCSDIAIRQYLRDRGLDTRREITAWMDQASGDYCYQGYRVAEVKRDGE